MPWKDVFSYVRTMADKRGVTDEAHRADDGLPLGARIGSLVRMQQSPVIRAQANGSLIALPGEADIRVLAVSQLRLEPQTELYRLYLVKGDDDAAKAGFSTRVQAGHPPRCRSSATSTPQSPQRSPGRSRRASLRT